MEDAKKPSDAPEGTAMDSETMLDLAIAAHNPMHGFFDKDGVYHPAPGYNVIGVNFNYP